MNTNTPSHDFLFTFYAGIDCSPGVFDDVVSHCNKQNDIVWENVVENLTAYIIPGAETTCPKIRDVIKELSKGVRTKKTKRVFLCKGLYYRYQNRHVPNTSNPNTLTFFTAWDNPPTKITGDFFGFSKPIDVSLPTTLYVYTQLLAASPANIKEYVHITQIGTVSRDVFKFTSQLDVLQNWRDTKTHATSRLNANGACGSGR
jgi:hypothetical protein